jgi:hypothetical protein
LRGVKVSQACFTETTKKFLILSLRYFKRFDAELEQLRIGDKIKGRQQQAGAKFSRENNIKMILERERQVYESSGFGKLRRNV